MGVTERLARACGGHPWRTVAVWIGAIVVGLGLAVVFLPGNLTSNGHLSGNPASERAERAFYQNFPPDRNTVDELVVVRSPRYTVDQPAFKRFVGSLVQQGSATGVVSNAFVYYRNGDRTLVSADRHATLIGIQRSADVDPLLPIVERNNGRDSFRVTITGSGTLDHDFNQLSQHDLKSGELGVGLPAALIILLLVFGTVVAGLMPLLMAILAIIVALGLTAIVADAFTLSIFVVNMLTAMGLALGIDYSLFVVSRYREERARGAAELDAIATSGATASRAVLFSGSTFVVAMLGMLLVPSNVMRSLAVGAIAVGITSVLAALTLLPALLGLLGDRVNALRVPWIGRNVGSQEARESRFWGAIVRRVMTRPATYLVVFTVLLLAAAAPAVGLNLGASGVATLPNRLMSKQGFQALARDFPRQSASPVLIVVEGNMQSTDVRTAITRLRADLAQNPAFGGAGDLRFGPTGDIAAITTPIAGDKNGARAFAAIRHLRSVDIPHAFAGVTGTQVLVGGDTADNVDFINAMNDWLPRVFIFVLGLSFLLLTARLPVDRDRSHHDRPQPALRRRRLRTRRARLPTRRRSRPARLPANQHDRSLGAAVPLHRPVRPVHGLPGLPTQPDQGTLRPNRLDERGDRRRRRLDRAADHRRRTDHRRRLPRLRNRRPRHVPTNGLRRRRRPPNRRHHHPLRPPPRSHDPPRRPQLVPATLARMDTQNRNRRQTPRHRTAPSGHPDAVTVRPPPSRNYG